MLDVTKAVLILKNNERRNFSWNNAKKMLSNPNSFLADLEEFKAEDIPEDVLQRLAPILKIKVHSWRIGLFVTDSRLVFQLRVYDQDQQRCRQLVQLGRQRCQLQRGLQEDCSKDGPPSTS